MPILELSSHQHKAQTNQKEVFFLQEWTIQKRGKEIQQPSKTKHSIKIVQEIYILAGNRKRNLSEGELKAALERHDTSNAIEYIIQVTVIEQQVIVIEYNILNSKAM